MEKKTHVYVYLRNFHSPQDKICSFKLAEALTEGIKASKLIRFENNGHVMFYKEKEKFNKEIMNFAG